MKQAMIKTAFPSSVETAKRLGIPQARRKELFGYIDTIATENNASKRPRRAGTTKRKVK